MLPIHPQEQCMAGKSTQLLFYSRGHTVIYIYMPTFSSLLPQQELGNDLEGCRSAGTDVIQPQHVCIAQRGRLFWKCRCTGRVGGRARASGAFPTPAWGKPWPCCCQTYLASIFLTGHFCMLHFGEEDCLILVISCFCWIPDGPVDHKNLSIVEQLAPSFYVLTYFSSRLLCPPTP